MKTWYVVVMFLSVSLLALVVGCDNSPATEEEKQQVAYLNDPAANPMNAEWTRPRQAGGYNQSLNNVDVATDAVHYGENVYYFARVESSFANSLAFFLVSHTNLEVTAIAPNVIRKRDARRIAPDDAGGRNWEYGMAVGYFVTFRQK